MHRHARSRAPRCDTPRTSMRCAKSTTAGAMGMVARHMPVAARVGGLKQSAEIQACHPSAAGSATPLGAVASVVSTRVTSAVSRFTLQCCPPRWTSMHPNRRVRPTCVWRHPKHAEESVATPTDGLKSNARLRAFHDPRRASGTPHATSATARGHDRAGRAARSDRRPWLRSGSLEPRHSVRAPT